MTLFNPLSNAIRWTTEIPQLAPGSSVLIQGPGQRGLCAVVAARDAGAAEVIVTGTTGDEHRLELARLLGATGVINSGKNDPVEAVAEITSGRMVDVVVDVSAGNDAAFDVATRSVRRGGEIVLAGLNGHRPAVGLITDRVVLNEIRITGALSAGYTAVKRAISLIESSRYDLEILCTHTFPLGEVEQALKTLGRENGSEMGSGEPVHVTLSAHVG
jgi:alcohol dehydrogenase